MADVLVIIGSFIFCIILINALVGDSIFITAVFRNKNLHKKKEILEFTKQRSTNFSLRSTSEMGIWGSQIPGSLAGPWTEME